MRMRFLLRRTKVRAMPLLPAVKPRQDVLPIDVQPTKICPLAPEVNLNSAGLFSPTLKTNCASWINADMKTASPVLEPIRVPFVNSIELSDCFPSVPTRLLDVSIPRASATSRDDEQISSIPASARRIPFHRLSYRQIGHYLVELASANNCAPENVNLIGVFEGIPINRIEKLTYESETEQLWFMPKPVPEEGTRWARAVVGRARDGSLIRTFELEGEEQ